MTGGDAIPRIGVINNPQPVKDGVNRSHQSGLRGLNIKLLLPRAVATRVNRFSRDLQSIVFFFIMGLRPSVPAKQRGNNKANNSSLQFEVVSMRLGKPISAPPRLSGSIINCFFYYGLTSIPAKQRRKNKANNSSLQFKVVSMRSGKPICAPPRLSGFIIKVFIMGLRPFQQNNNERTRPTSVQGGIYALGKAHMRSTPSLRGFPSVALETVPMFV